MRVLTKEERDFLESLLKLTPQKHGGYMVFTKNKKHYKRSRVLLQLYLNIKLEVWEIVHHKDENRQNDNLDNLTIMTSENHSSLHCAGKRRNK